MASRFDYLELQNHEDDPPQKVEKIRRKPKFDDKVNYQKRGEKRKRRRRSPKQ